MQVKNILLEHAFEVSSFLFFVGPMTLICVLYVLIGVKLRKSKLLQGVKRRGVEFGRGISGQTRVIRMLGKFVTLLTLTSDANHNFRFGVPKQNAKMRNFVWTLFYLLFAVAVAVAFFLCWAPFHAQRLMAVYGKTSSTPMSCIFRRTYTVLTYVSGVLYFMSTCINPLLYSIMSHKFRDAFKVSFLILWYSVYFSPKINKLESKQNESVSVFYMQTMIQRQVKYEWKTEEEKTKSNANECDPIKNYLWRQK